MDLSITKMTLNDLEQIKNILATDFDDFWSYDILKQELQYSNSYFIVAKNNDNTIVGFAGIKVIVDNADIMNIVVRKDIRNQKIGSILLNYLINLSKQLALKSITLEVNENNFIAIHLYEKMNFKIIGIRKKYYNNIDNAIIMRHAI